MDSGVHRRGNNEGEIVYPYIEGIYMGRCGCSLPLSILFHYKISKRLASPGITLLLLDFLILTDR